MGIRPQTITQLKNNFIYCKQTGENKPTELRKKRKSRCQSTASKEKIFPAHEVKFSNLNN